MRSDFKSLTYQFIEVSSDLSFTKVKTYDCVIVDEADLAVERSAVIVDTKEKRLVGLAAILESPRVIMMTATTPRLYNQLMKSICPESKLVLDVPSKYFIVHGESNMDITKVNSIDEEECLKNMQRVILEEQDNIPIFVFGDSTQKLY